MKYGMYYRADNEDAIEAYCEDCVPNDYSAWEDIIGEETCMVCGACIKTDNRPELNLDE